MKFFFLFANFGYTSPFFPDLLDPNKPKLKCPFPFFRRALFFYHRLISFITFAPPLSNSPTRQGAGSVTVAPLKRPFSVAYIATFPSGPILSFQRLFPLSSLTSSASFLRRSIRPFFSKTQFSSFFLSPYRHFFRTVLLMQPNRISLGTFFDGSQSGFGVPKVALSFFFYLSFG